MMLSSSLDEYRVNRDLVEVCKMMTNRDKFVE